MMKTLLKIALCLILAIFTVMAITSCDSTKESKGLEFHLSDNDTYEVIGIGECKDLDIVIPQKHKGKPVIKIDDAAFSGCDEITSVTIPDSVAFIGELAFSNCEELTEINIPASILTIGNNAFQGCEDLAKVNIADLAAWCDITFYNIFSNPLYFAKKLSVKGESVTDLVIPNGVTSIASYAFAGCNRLTSVTIPDGVTKIGNSAFLLCSRLERVTLGNNLTDVGIDAFASCDDLAYTEYENGNYLGNENNPYQVLISIPSTDISSFVIHPNTKAIGGGTFSYCSKLTAITLPEGLVFVGRNAFSNCHSLTEITIPDSVTKIGYNAFGVCYELANVTFGKGLKSIDASAFAWCGSLKNVTLPDGLESIGTLAFRYPSLESVTIPKSVTKIAKNAFSGSPTIYCQASRQPKGWDNEWAESGCTVIWGAQDN